MKKTYQKPVVSVLVIESSVVCGSISGTNGADGLGYGGDSSDHNITTGNAPRYGSWNDYEN